MVAPRRYSYMRFVGVIREAEKEGAVLYMRAHDILMMTGGLERHGGLPTRQLWTITQVPPQYTDRKVYASSLPTIFVMSPGCLGK